MVSTSKMVERFSPNEAINAVIHELLRLGCPPIPVAPKQDPRKKGCHHQTFIEQRVKLEDCQGEIQGRYCRVLFTQVGDGKAPVKGDYCRLDENLQPIARFTGKNPSYIGAGGSAVTVNHKAYQDRLPTHDELRTWFSNPLTGIGTLGGHNGVDWLDFDAKNYPNQEECDRDVQAILNRVGDTWVERTGSGGWRVAVRPKERPTFTNFTTTYNGENHIGEALYQGRFTVLDPTIHPNGNPYKRIGAGDPVAIESLQAIGIYPTKDEQKNQARRQKRKERIARGEFVVTDPSKAPWDMRNLGEYLSGYRIEGDYAECKCPAHSGNSDNSLSIHLDTGAFWCWSGCDTRRIFNETKRIAIASGYNPVISQEVELPSYDLTYSPNICVNSRYLGKLEIPSTEKLIALKSAKGTGKTESIAALVAETHQKGLPAYVVTYREQLGCQLGERLGVPYKSEVWNTPTGKLFGYAFCVDSAHPGAEVPFWGEGKHNSLVVIDELESVVWHTLDSSTCTDKRLPILTQLEILFKGVLSPVTLGRVVVADADLSDISINFIKKLGGQLDLKPFIVLNEWKPGKGWDIFDYSKPTDLYTGIMEAIAKGGKHQILTTGQRVNSKWGTQTLEVAIQKRFPGKKVLRIDSHTIADPSHPAYQAIANNLNELLKEYDIVICSPSIESGVSIDLKGYYTAVWLFATGAIPEASVRQLAARLRDLDVPRHVFIAERGIPTAFVGSGETDPQSLLKTEHKKARATIHNIQDSSIKIATDGSIEFNTAALEAWAKIGARVNKGLKNYKASVMAGFKAEGHSIYPAHICLDKDTSKAVSTTVGGIRTENHQAEAKRISDRPLISDGEYEELKNKRSKTADEARNLRHYELNKRYCVGVTPELVLKDDDGWHNFIRIHYFLTIGSEFLKGRDRARFKEIADLKGRYWEPDLNKRLFSYKVQLLKELKLDQLLSLATAGEQLYNKHPLVLEIASVALEKADLIKDFLSIKVTTSNTNMAIVQELLDTAIGFRLVKVGQIGPKGDRHRVYEYEHPQDGRDEVFNAWMKRDSNMVEMPAIEQLEVVPELVGITHSESEMHTKSHKYINGVNCAHHTFSKGSQVTCAHGVGIVVQVDGEWIRIEGNSFLAWHLASQIKAVAPSNSAPDLNTSPNVPKPVAVTPSAAQPESDSVDGWNVGDIAIVAVDHLDDYSQKEIIKNNEAPVGQKVLILGFEHDSVLKRWFAVTRLPNGDKCDLPPVFLRRIETCLTVAGETLSAADEFEFQKGDRVRLSADNFDRYEAKQVRREVGQLYDLSGEVIGVELRQLFPLLPTLWYRVLLDDGQECEYPGKYFTAANPTSA